MNHERKTPTLRDIKVVLGTLKSGLADALGLGPVPEMEPRTTREIGRTYLMDNQLLIVPSGAHPDLAALAGDVVGWLGSNLSYSQPLRFGLVPTADGLLVRNQYDYFNLIVNTSRFPEGRSIHERDRLIALVSSDCHPYPLDVRAPIMKGLQDYLAKSQNHPVSPPSPRAA